ncbi:diguanylate cyclase [Fibrobacterota bacterium]
MRNFWHWSGNIVLISAGLVGIHYLPSLALPDYKYSFLAFVCLIGLLSLFSSNRQGGVYGYSYLAQVLFLYLITLVGLFYLRGLYYEWNPALLILTCSAVSLTARPLLALAGVAFMWAVYATAFLNQLYAFLPGARIVFWNLTMEETGYPLISATVAGLLALAVNYRRIQNITRGTPVSRSSGMAIRATGAVKEQEQVPEAGAHPDGAEGYVSRDYLVKQEDELQTSMSSILDTVVYFMSRNFKSLSAIGFLASEDGNRFYMNAVVSKSRFLNSKAVITKGKGIIGRAALKSTGLVTGDVKSYPGKLEYYSEPEEINSVMAMPVKDPETGVIKGLLVVDSSHIRAFTDEHKELLRRFTQIAAAMVTNAQLTDKVHKQAQWADTLYEVTSLLTKVLKVEEIISILGESLTKIFAHRRVVICVYNAKNAKGQIWDVLSNADGLKRGQEFDIKNTMSIYGRVFRQRKETVIQNFREEMGDFVRFGFEGEPEERPQELLIAPVFNENQAIIAVVGMESNQRGVYSGREMRMLKTLLTNFSTAITKARLYSEMEKLATVDGLTHIPNHRKFQEFIFNELTRSQRYKDKLSLLLMDIDHFKNFNDTYGHPVGDEVLRSVAKTLQKVIRGTDLCARYGGEEFVVVMIKADEAAAAMLAERIRQAIEAMEIPNEGEILKVTVSIGSATYPQDGMTKQEIIDNADKAMYHSKENGRNRITCFSAVGES